MASSNKTTSLLFVFFYLIGILFFSLVTAQRVPPYNPLELCILPTRVPSPTIGSNCPESIVEICSCSYDLRYFPTLVPPSYCCSLIRRLDDPEAVACLCTARNQTEQCDHW